MLGWIKERIEIGRLAQQRADRLVEENKMLRNLVDSRQKEIDRLNRVIDQVTSVVHSWKR